MSTVTVWVAVIEWGSNYGDREPGIIVRGSWDAVRREAAVQTLEFGDLEEPEIVADLPTLDPEDPASVDAWLMEWHEATTQAWLTVTSAEVSA